MAKHEPACLFLRGGTPIKLPTTFVTGQHFYTQVNIAQTHAQEPRWVLFICGLSEAECQENTHMLLLCPASAGVCVYVCVRGA